MDWRHRATVPFREPPGLELLACNKRPDEYCDSEMFLGSWDRCLEITRSLAGHWKDAGKKYVRTYNISILPEKPDTVNVLSETWRRKGRVYWESRPVVSIRSLSSHGGCAIVWSNSYFLKVAYAEADLLNVLWVPFGEHRHRKSSFSWIRMTEEEASCGFIVYF